MLEYKALVVQDWLSPNFNVKDVLRIYRKWNIISSAPKWGQIPLACTCKICYPYCVCQCTILLASLFNPDIRVPVQYIAATVSFRKTCLAIKGTAGYKRQRLLEAANCDEKTIDSKVGNMQGSKSSKPPTPVPGPDVVLVGQRLSGSRVTCRL